MIHADITEFLSNPIGTGIQRTVRELFRYWPGGLPACYFDPQVNGLRVISPEALAMVLDNSTDNDAKEKAADAARIISLEPGALLGDDAYVLIPELFYDHARCAFYAQRIGRDPSRTLAIIYDLLPWTHPQLFGITDRSAFEPYFRLIFSLAYTAHISEETKAAYEKEAGRKPWPLPVLHLGADGITIGKQSFRSDRTTFVSLGSIEKRKGQMDILTAFESLWEDGVAANLLFVGRVVDHGDETALRRITAAERYPFFKRYERASDDALANILSDARATIMASEYEGYGIPPIESLYAGIPVIVSDTMPSTRRLPGLGQIRVRPNRPNQIESAVLTLLDDGEALRLWGEAATIELPTWKDTTMQVHRWVWSIVSKMSYRRAIALQDDRNPAEAALRQWMASAAT